MRARRPPQAIGPIWAEGERGRLGPKRRSGTGRVKQQQPGVGGLAAAPPSDDPLLLAAAGTRPSRAGLKGPGRGTHLELEDGLPDRDDPLGAAAPPADTDIVVVAAEDRARPADEDADADGPPAGVDRV